MAGVTKSQTVDGPPKKERKWDGASRGGVVGNWIFFAVTRSLGLRAAYTILFPVALYYILFDPTSRRASIDYLKRIGYSGRLNLLVKSFRHFLTFGKVLLDKLSMGVCGSDSFTIEFDGEEHMHSALKQGKGLIILSGHCGNWAAAGQLLRRLEQKINIIAYQGESEKIKKFLSRVFKDHPFDVIAADGGGDTSLAIIAALNRGEVVAMHADRCFNEPGIEVDFLGGRASFPKGPFVVAALSSSPVIQTFAMREGLYKYHFYAEPSQNLSFTKRTEREKNLTSWIGDYAASYEKILKKYPLQWFNFYDFWQGNDSN
jgi:predicted LPLAT superfamily acyltransferase